MIKPYLAIGFLGGGRVEIYFVQPLLSTDIKYQ